jgi:predicted ATPase
VTLWGRREQCEVLDGLLADVRAERSRVLVVRGEPGIGKSALLGYAADTAQDFQVAQAEGVESEMELPYAALQQLCGRMLDRLDRLPGPQHEALGVAFVARRRLDAETVAPLFGTSSGAGVLARDPTDANALVPGGEFWHGQSAACLGTGRRLR